VINIWCIPSNKYPPFGTFAFSCNNINNGISKDNTFVTGRLKSVKGALKVNHDGTHNGSIFIGIFYCWILFWHFCNGMAFQTLAIGFVMSIEGLNTAVEKKLILFTLS
jgi:hypothetical protein